MKTMLSRWENVEDVLLTEAILIAWDGCHKIYIATDEIEAEWFRANYDETFEGMPSEMLATLTRWYDASCGLKFIQSVGHNAADPNAGFTNLIEQGAYDEQECAECGDTALPGSDWCEMCEPDGTDDADDEDD